MGIPGPTDQRWGFVRERTCQQKQQQQPAFLWPEVGGDHRCSWPSEGGLFLLKLDLRAPPCTLSVLNLQTRKEARVMEVPYEEAGWRLCGSLVGASSLHSSAQEIMAQQDSIAQLLSAGGGAATS